MDFDDSSYQNGGYIIVITKDNLPNVLNEALKIAEKYNITSKSIIPFESCSNKAAIIEVTGYNLDLSMEYKSYQGKDDIVHLRTIPSLNKPGVAIFDMDSTCIQIECIDEIARAYGVGDEIAKITSRAMHGELDFKQSLRLRVSKLKDAPVSILENLRNNLPLMPGFKELVKFLQEHDWKIAIASGGFTPFVGKLKEDFNLTKVHANTFEIEGDHLTGGLIGEIVDSTVKVRTLDELCEEFNIPLSQTMAIGDGANDLPMILHSALGLAIHAKPIVRQKATGTINNFGLDAAVAILEGKRRLEALKNK